MTPGPDLNNKWHSEFSRFSEMYSFGESVERVRSLREFVEKVRRHPVVVAPVTMFQSGRGSGAQTYLLSLYFHWKGHLGFPDGSCYLPVASEIPVQVPGIT